MSYISILYLPFKSLGSVRFSFKEIYDFIQQKHIQLIKSDSKDIYNVIKCKLSIHKTILQ